MYGPVSLKPLPHNYKPRPLPLPRTGALEDDKDVLGTETDEEDVEEEGEAREEVDQSDEGSSEPLMEGLLTLSTLPKSHWASLPNLELIKVGTPWQTEERRCVLHFGGHMCCFCVIVCMFEACVWGRRSLLMATAKQKDVGCTVLWY